MYDSIAT
jgi:hypothetical protein